MTTPTPDAATFTPGESVLNDSVLDELTPGQRVAVRELARQVVDAEFARLLAEIDRLDDDQGGGDNA